MSHTTPTTHTYDIAIIGGGSGGLVMAAVAAGLGHRVVLFEGHKMGGDCLNYGCVPSKALLAAAHRGASFKEAMADVKRAITTIEPHDSQARFEKLGVHVVRAFARFADPHTLEADSTLYRARRIVIASGSRAFIPPIQGLENTPYLTNESLFNLSKTPTHLAVIGTGPIGVEMAQAFARLGCHVSLIGRSAHILPRDDQAAAAVVRAQLIKDGIDLYESAETTQANHTNGTTTLTLKQDGTSHTLHASHVLVATGRTPVLAPLNLDAAGVRFTPQGIPTNQAMQTNVRHIYAVGDVAGPYQFTHMAAYQAGLVISRSLFGNIFTRKQDTAVPWVTYTSPELAHVGLSEAAARQRYGAHVRTTRVPWQDVDRAIAEGDTHGFLSVVTGKKGRVLGATCVGKEAGEHLALWAYMVANKQKISTLSRTILPYPTRGEIAKKVLSAYYKNTFYSPKTGRLSRFLFRLLG